MQDNNVILKGIRNTNNGMWTLNLDNQPKEPITNNTSSNHIANNVYKMNTKHDIVTYLHQACCSPVTSTWIKAIEAGHFTTWPGLTADLVPKHLHKSVATAKGHLWQERQGLRSTQSKSKPTNSTNPIQPIMTTPESSDVRTHWVFSNQTGRFPITSSRGNKYIMVVYDYDSNAILTEPLTSRRESKLLRAYTKIHTYLTDRGLKPVLQKLDNKAPGTLQKFMRDNDVTFQLAPPAQHCRNAAEKAISTWKDHFIAALPTTDPKFPLHLWCHLINQATTTLNLLRTSRINPRLLLEAQLNRAFDYNKTPYASPGSKVVIHEKTTHRKTWAADGGMEWMAGTSAKHQNTTDAIESTLPKQHQNTSQTWSNCFRTTAKC